MNHIQLNNGTILSFEPSDYKIIGVEITIDKCTFTIPGKVHTYYRTTKLYLDKGQVIREWSDSVETKNAIKELKYLIYFLLLLAAIYIIVWGLMTVNN